MSALLISGTDTGAGKTILTTALAAYWQHYFPAERLGILKPLQSGEGDREWYNELFGLDLAEVNPLHFEAPLAPPLAAAKEGAEIKLEKAWAAFEALQQSRDWVLVEGVGGLGSPITWETTVADLAWDWRLPTVLVVPVRLGAIAQAVANVALARQNRLHLKGIVLNCPTPCSKEEIANWAPAKMIRSLTGIPVLGCLPFLADPKDREKLVQSAAALDLERLLPMLPA
ncbi:dethiobiotin synthase [Geitlerinema sp. PCC 7407]|uniref:dethiobiotin synthase n=1 Tax=Geitlerinema sp. PCC 7407 TaxID=1173025 RepID=UPI00029FDCED|nr:dethiobiotin synthase [Geitlerinema sp. PCC 7407]AFY67441.1 dethiobiotin synthase [Geitlerinema sp. PCC 7407]